MYKNEVEKLLAEGLAQLESSGVLAKAAQGGKNPLDSDFSEFDQARNESDAHEDDDDSEGQDDGEGGDGDSDTDADSDDQGDDDGESDDGSDDDDSDDEDDSDSDSDAKKAPGVIAKSVDAMPLLEAIEGRLTEIVGHNAALLADNASLRKQVRTLAKAVAGLSDGTQMIAKAVSGRMDTPLPPKHLRGKAAVPTGVTTQVTSGLSAQQVFAKADKAVQDGLLDTTSMSLLNGMVNQFGVDNALAQLPQVHAVLKGVK